MLIPDNVQVGMMLDDFIRQYNEAPFELLDGERKLIMPGVARHIVTITYLLRILDRHVTDHDLGVVFPEAPFVLTYSSNWVKGSRTPDIMFIAKEKFEAYIAATPDWGDKPFILVPDLVIEVVSPNDVFSEINAKVRRYREDGVRLIWVIDPQERNMYIFPAGKSADMRFENDLLDGGDVLPGFSVPVSEIFKH